MIGFIVDVEFIWGFQARIAGLSKTNPSFYYPPPSTFLGALASVIAKKNMFGEKRGLKLIPALSRNLLAISFKPINLMQVKYEDINRILAVRIRSGVLYPNPRDPFLSFDSPARGKTITMSLDDNPPKMRWVLVFRDDKLSVDGDEVVLNEDYFWGISRLGSKESIVSVVNVEKVEDLDVRKGGEIITQYSFPMFYVDGNKFSVIEHMWKIETYVNPFEIEYYDANRNPVKYYIEGKNVLPFYIPIMAKRENPEVLVAIKKEFVSYAFSEKDVVIGRGD